MATDVLRMNYFNGLFLTEKEFNVEQDYHIRMRRLINRHLFTPGIVWGLKLEIDSADDHILKITEGMAFNLIKDDTFDEQISQEIINTKQYPMDFRDENDLFDPDKPELAADEVYIYISHSEDNEGKFCTNEKGDNEQIHWKESAHFVASNSEPAEVNSNGEMKYIILGKVKIVDDGKIDSIYDTESLLQHTGPRAHSLSTDEFTTNKLNLSFDGAAGSMASIEGKDFVLDDGTKLNGIQVNSPLTSFSGLLEVGGLEISSILNDLKSIGWVTLPFLPMKFQDFHEFQHVVTHSTSISHPSGESNAGVMIIPVPPKATKVKNIRINGYSKEDVYFKLVRAGKTDVDTITVFENTAIGTMDSTVPIDLDKQSLDTEIHGLSLYVETTDESDIRLIAVEFE